MIRKATLLIIAIYAVIFLAPVALASAPKAPEIKDKFVALAPLSISLLDHQEAQKYTINTVVFRHGDISWLPELAIKAGWETKHLPKLGEIILRESGGCPNRKGGDKVDKDCNITGVSEWSHRSDSGLLQINGVHYNLKRNKWALACREMNICTQEPLLDAVTNLKFGKLLYDEAGWSPWDVCSWNPTAKGCK